jgi:Fe-S oxidoreductase
VTTIVTTCPHCFHQIGNEYPQLGGNYEVIHHSTYIERLLETGRVRSTPIEGKGSSSPTTTAATSVATTMSTTRRARRFVVRCRS